MKKIVLFIAITLYCFQLFSQTGELVNFKVEKGGNTYYGLKDKSGNIVANPKFLGIEKIEDYYLCTTVNSVSYFNSSGKLLAEYGVIKPFKYGVSIVVVFTEDGDGFCGLINKEGKIILPPNKYYSINDFNENRQASAFIEKGSQISEFIIDTTGNVIKEIKR